MLYRETVKKNEMARTCSTYGQTRDANRVLVGKLDGRKPLARPKRGMGG
jgi:hypothetical protein